MSPKNITVTGVRSTPIARRGETVTVADTKRVRDLVAAGYLQAEEIDEESDDGD